MASDETTANLDTIDILSEPMQRVLAALIEGQAPPPDADAALTEAERAEIAALGRTAHLTYIALHQPEPSTVAEEKALDRARKELARRQTASAGNGVTSPPVTVPRPALLAWLERLRKREE
jgi:hypothetical protein